MGCPSIRKIVVLQGQTLKFLNWKMPLSIPLSICNSMFTYFKMQMIQANIKLDLISNYKFQVCNGCLQHCIAATVTFHADVIVIRKRPICLWNFPNDLCKMFRQISCIKCPQFYSTHKTLSMSTVSYFYWQAMLKIVQASC